MQLLLIATLTMLCAWQIVFPTTLDNRSMSFDAQADMKRIGGPVRLQNLQEVQVKVYVDHSAVEVFLSSGEALTTRYDLAAAYATLLWKWVNMLACNTFTCACHHQILS